MIGLVCRLMGFGGGGGLCAVVLGALVAICALFGINRCMRWRMRDCACIKRCMRASGADKFDDFEMMVHVHEVLYTPSKAKLSTMVRVTAGPHLVKTDEVSKGIVQQMLQIFVEQGTDVVLFELLDSRERKVLASMKLDTMKDILEVKGIVSEKIYTMKQKSKGVLNPRIKLTIVPHSDSEVEKGLLANIGHGTSSETSLMLRQQLHKATLVHKATLGACSSDEDAFKGFSSELDLLAKGCAGPLDMFGSWGSRTRVYVAVRGPPDMKRYFMGIWKDKSDFDKGVKPNPEIDLLRVMSVQPDPARTEVFMLQYLDQDKVKKKMQFRRLDRARDVWVEMFQLLIKQVHERKDRNKEKQRYRS